MQKYSDRTKGAEIEEKDHALVWHYTNVEPEIAFRRASELRQELAELLEAPVTSSLEGKSIFAHDKSGKVAAAYEGLTKEVMQVEQRAKDRLRADGVR